MSMFRKIPENTIPAIIMSQSFTPLISEFNLCNIPLISARLIRLEELPNWKTYSKHTIRKLTGFTFSQLFEYSFMEIQRTLRIHTYQIRKLLKQVLTTINNELENPEVFNIGHITI